MNNKAGRVPSQDEHSTKINTNHNFAGDLIFQTSQGEQIALRGPQTVLPYK